MSESYEVDVPALAGHVRRLNGLADELRSVLDTVAVSLPADAFGETGRSAAVALDGLGQAGQDTVRAGVEGLESESGKVHSSAVDYEQRQADAKARFDEVGASGRIGPGLPETPTS